ncbi:hypothetical protein D8674_000154 [Pyrus ussuriensis x Pyrus communis]|uniref:Uncharacterized protein n=1 Tax=Pyrus ussuriensis x Pyrus communis TaxID=2448454 RepID=A0A5N5FFN4_9ROSA|nr:hypothetical protein D8674_000154 [Pyrus ussuriensis x Pyrus communis]
MGNNNGVACGLGGKGTGLEWMNDVTAEKGRYGMVLHGCDGEKVNGSLRLKEEWFWNLCCGCDGKSAEWLHRFGTKCTASMVKICGCWL